MKLTKVTVKNFRLLHDVEISFANSSTTVIVGKNNSGKTSLTTIFDIFLNSKKFGFSDFSLASHEVFFTSYKQYKENSENKIEENFPKIQLYLTIRYDDTDNWSLIRPFLTSLEENNEITILCEYAPKLTEKFLKHLSKILLDANENNLKERLLQKIDEYHHEYYEIKIRPYSEFEETDNINRADFNNLVSAKFIGAQRVLADGTSENVSKLSKIFHNQFDYKHEQDKKTYDALLNALSLANEKIEEQLSTFFKDFIEGFSKFGFPGLGEEKITLKSRLKQENLFKDNVELLYLLGNAKLPEKYNGLGYSNLIYIIAQIMDFSKQVSESGNKLNLIFIEEPEAHMHPQMQNVFVKKIGDFLNSLINYQVILTTHSSHILSSTKPHNIRYFLKKEQSTEIKDLSTIKDNFLTQYLTLGICDLFFADKAILVEGTVERVLYPIFVQKIEKANSQIGLSQQYVAIIEVGGAYAHRFKELLELLELKILVITDIDSVKLNENNRSISCEVTDSDECTTSNPILKSWIPQKSEIKELLYLQENEKIAGNIRVAYQKKTSDTPLKCGRSFEEAFIIENSSYIFNYKDNLSTLKNKLTKYDSEEKMQEKSYEIQEFISKNNKKVDFAFDLVSTNQDDWKVPDYIKEGLEWLAK